MDILEPELVRISEFYNEVFRRTTYKHEFLTRNIERLWAIKDVNTENPYVNLESRQFVVNEMVYKNLLPDEEYMYFFEYNPFEKVYQIFRWKEDVLEICVGRDDYLEVYKDQWINEYLSGTWIDIDDVIQSNIAEMAKTKKYPRDKLNQKEQVLFNHYDTVYNIIASIHSDSKKMYPAKL